MTMNVSERSPRINEPVVLECKLYTTSLADSLANMEQLISSDDFKIEPIDLRGSAWQIEHRNGKNYRWRCSGSYYSIPYGRENFV